MQKQEKSLIKDTANLFNNTIIMIVLISVLFSTVVNIISSVAKVDLKTLTKSNAYVCISYTLSSIALFSALIIFSKTNSPFHFPILQLNHMEDISLILLF